VLKINGAERGFADGVPATVADLLEHLGIKAATVVAEIDGKIIQREKFAQTKLRKGQSIELVRFAGGG